MAIIISMAISVYALMWCEKMKCLCLKMWNKISSCIVLTNDVKNAIKKTDYHFSFQ